MTTHRLKTWPAHFEPIAAGIKTAELRLDDRGFEVGDILRLEEYRPDTPEMRIGGAYTGRVLDVRVTHILRDATYLREGYVMLSFAAIPATGSAK